MAKFRVYEIAKKYNKDNKEILEILKANHVEVKNHMSTIGCLLYTSPSPRDCS